MSESPEPVRPGSIVLITGVMAVGKSTVAQLLAERLQRSVHLRGDLFRRLIVKGGVNMVPEGGDEALEQLRLRYRVAAAAAEVYADAGFTVVCQDVILGEDLAAQVARLRTRPIHVVVLLADPAVVARREAGRQKKGYEPWAVGDLDDVMRHRTARIGLWIDTSAQTPSETVDEIISRASEARVNR